MPNNDLNNEVVNLKQIPGVYLKGNKDQYKTNSEIFITPVVDNGNMKIR